MPVRTMITGRGYCFSYISLNIKHIEKVLINVVDLKHSYLGHETIICKVCHFKKISIIRFDVHVKNAVDR